jgi:prepilin-type N-terminal cleavage/methylation domain-containing protein
MMQPKATNRTDAGFTLIELLVVVVILGVLAAIVVLAVGGVADRGETSAEKADRATITHAEEAYLARTSGALKYATEAELVPGFMSDPSTLHDICLSPNKKAYLIVTQPSSGDGCADVSVPNP